MITQYNLTQKGVTQETVTQKRTNRITISEQFPHPLIYAWYDAANCIVDESGYVSQMTDKKGTNDAVQTTQVNKPLQVLNELNGTPVLRFAGNQWLKKQFPAEISQPVTVFAVWKVTTAGPYRFCFDNYSTRYFSLYSTNSVIETYTSSYFNYSKTSPFNYILNAVVFNTISSALYENGVLMASGNVGTNTLNGLSIGNSYQGSYPLIGDIAEIIIFDSLLSDLYRTTVESYLMTKYAL